MYTARGAENYRVNGPTPGNIGKLATAREYNEQAAPKRLPPLAFVFSILGSFALGAWNQKSRTEEFIFLSFFLTLNCFRTCATVIITSVTSCMNCVGEDKNITQKQLRTKDPASTLTEERNQIWQPQYWPILSFTNLWFFGSVLPTFFPFFFLG